MSAPPKLPIVILTGFLGSGKTTLLNALLRLPSFADTAVVVNEFGEIGLDHLLVESAQENVILLDGGCLCCTVIDSLKETLADLYHRRARGTLPAFSRIIIETTGLADPCPILQQLMSDSLLSHLYTVHSLVCVVDSLFGASQLDVHPEARLQAALADKIWITKIDLTGGTLAAGLADRLRALNSLAETTMMRPDTDLCGILRDATYPVTLAAAPITPHTELYGVLRDATAHPTPMPLAYPMTRRHDMTISAHSFWIDEPVNWAGIAAWVDWLKESCGDRLLRCKALLNVEGTRGPLVLHGVRTVFKTSTLPEWPTPERRSALVVIGRDLDPRHLQAGLQRLRSADAMEFHA